MQAKQAAKLAGYVLLGLLAATLAGAFVFIPRSQEPPYEFVKAWGGQGDGPGQFSDPTGIAVAGDEVFVADARNDRIQVFDLDGRFKRQFGQPGQALGELGRPMNLSVAGDRLYVSEYFNDRVQIFSLDGTPERTIGESGEGPAQFDAPGGVTAAPNGDVFVADSYNHRVQQLRGDGTFVRQWGTTGRAGITGGQFNYPTDVALGSNGVLYVADGYNDRIQAFAEDGSLIRKWGGPFAMNIPGPFNGWFAVATSVSIGPRGDVFVADFYHDRVQKFCPQGYFQTAFGVTGAGPGQFHHPLAVAVAADGSVFVTDFLNHRVQKWRPARTKE